MFCDMVGSSALATRLDPEEQGNVIAAFHACCADEIKSFGGTVAQYLGDGVLAYFGYPTAHENDAERAILAGLAILKAVGRLKAGGDMALQTRIAVGSGVVVVGDLAHQGVTQENAAIGETTNLVARLQAIAEPNSIVISPVTHRLVSALFEYRDLGLHALKGFSDPVHVRQVLGPSKVESRFEARRAGALSPLIGRQEEIELLLRRWDQAKRGEGRVVLLSGEPGIGKSRIVESLLAGLVGEPHTRLRYFSSPHHTNSTLYPSITQLERAAGFEAGSSAAAKLDKLEALLEPTAKNAPRDLALIAELLAVPTDGRYPVVEVSPQQKREMILTALLDQLDAVAARSPVLTVFEDIHWIDPTSLDLLDRTVARVANMPVLLIVTFRPELEPTWVGQPHVTMLPLSRLGRHDSADIIGGVTKGKALPDAVVEQVLAHTDGVPLFIEELTSTLLESGLLRETTDRYVLDGPLPPLAVPTTLQASLVARLDRLAPVKDVAQIGAAIGREFSHELIAAVAALAPKDLDTALERLTASGLISRRGTPPAATYSFKHALVRDAAYATMLKSRRRQLHASIANALVERFSALAERLPEIVAHHFTEAGLASKAIGYWMKAGQLASARSANREAVRFFEQALGALEALPESPATLGQGFDIRFELRPVLQQLGEVPRVLERLREAESLAERLNDDRRRGQVCAFMTAVQSELGALDEAFVAGTRALEIAGRLGDLRLCIPARTYMEMAHYFRGEYERVIELAIDNLAALPADWVYEYFGLTAPASIYDRYWLLQGLAQVGGFAKAAEYESDALRLADAEPRRHAFTVGQAYYSAGTLHLFRGDWVKARSRLEHAIAVFRTGNVVAALPYAVALSAWVLAQLGEGSEAVNQLREGEQLLDDHGTRRIVSLRGWSYHALGRACLLLGRLEEARRLGDRAIKYSEGFTGFAAHALHLLGDIASHPDRFDGESGESHYREALVLAETRSMRPLVAHCHLGLGRLNRRTGKRQQAQEHVATATTMYRDMGMTYWLEQAEAVISADEVRAARQKA